MAKERFIQITEIRTVEFENSSFHPQELFLNIDDIVSFFEDTERGGVIVVLSTPNYYVRTNMSIAMLQEKFNLKSSVSEPE